MSAISDPMSSLKAYCLRCVNVSTHFHWTVLFFSIRPSNPHTEVVRGSGHIRPVQMQTGEQETSQTDEMKTSLQCHDSIGVVFIFTVGLEVTKDVSTTKRRKAFDASGGTLLM